MGAELLLRGWLPLLKQLKKPANTCTVEPKKIYDYILSFFGFLWRNLKTTEAEW